MLLIHGQQESRPALPVWKRQGAVAVCSLQAFHSAEFSVHMESDSHWLYLFSIVFSIVCIGPPTGKWESPVLGYLYPCSGISPGQTPAVAGPPHNPILAQRVVRFHGFLSSWVCTVRTAGMGVCVSSPGSPCGVSLPCGCSVQVPFEDLCVEHDWQQRPATGRNVPFLRSSPIFPPASFNLAC